MLLNSWLLNGGDAAVALAEREQLVRHFGAETRVVVSSPQHRAARALYADLDPAPQLLSSGGPANPALRWTRRVRLSLALRVPAARGLLMEGESRHLGEMAETDALIAGGGTYLTDYYKLDGILFDYEAARLLDKPLFFFPQSIGPLENPARARSVARAIAHSRGVFVRDEESKAQVLRLAPEAERKTVVLADSAFHFARHHERGVLNPNRRAVEPRSGRPLAIVSARYWSFPGATPSDQAALRARCRAQLAQTVTELVRGGMDVRFLSTTQGCDDYDDDAAFAKSVAETLGAETRNHVAIDESRHRPEELVASYAACDAVLSMRMHGVILALCAGTPVVALAGEFKTRELMGRLGLSNRTFDAETFESGETVRAVRDAAAGGSLPQRALDGIAEMEESCARAPVLLGERLG